MNRLIIPGTLPSVNHQYKNARTGRRTRRVLTPEAKQWETDIQTLATIWRASTRWKTANRKVVVRLWYFWPDARKRDTHNTLKLLLDAFEKAGIYTNDQLALPRIMDYEIDRKNPRVEVEFEEMKGA